MESFETTWDQELAADKRAYSENIINSLRERRLSDTGKWLNELVRENGPQLTLESVGVGNDAAQRMFKFVERLFDDLDRYSAEFNNQALGSDAMVSCSRPSQDPNLDADRLNRTEIYQGHLSTRYWAMVFSVEKQSLNIYIIPAEVLLAFRAGTEIVTKYQPFMTVTGAWDADGSHYRWQFGDMYLDEQLLPALAKELFRDLVQVACGSLNENDLDHEHVAEAIEPTDDIESQGLMMSAQPMDPVLETQPIEANAVLESMKVMEPPELLALDDQSKPVAARPISRPSTDARISAAFWCQSEMFLAAIDQELGRLGSAASAAAQMSDLGKMARCKRLVISLTNLRDEIANQTQTIAAVSNDDRAVA